MSLNPFGNDMTLTDRMNAGADAMKATRLGTPAPTATGTTSILKSGASTALPTTNQYGNDMTLTNRMNAGADQMKKARLGAPATGTPSILKPIIPKTTTGTPFQAPEAPKVDLFARPGDSFGDSQMREQQHQSLLNQSASTPGITKNQRAAMAGAAQGLLAPGLQQAALQNQAHEQQTGTYNQAIQSGYLPGAPPTAAKAALPDPTKPAADAAPDQPQFPPALMDFLKQFQAFQMQQTNPTTGLSAVGVRDQAL